MLGNVVPTRQPLSSEFPTASQDLRSCTLASCHSQLLRRPQIPSLGLSLQSFSFDSFLILGEALLSCPSPTPALLQGVLTHIFGALTPEPKPLKPQLQASSKPLRLPLLPINRWLPDTGVSSLPRPPHPHPAQVFPLPDSGVGWC